jgi:hypothetical protein
MCMRNTPIVHVCQVLFEQMRSFLEMGVWFGGQTVYTVDDRFK